MTAESTATVFELQYPFEYKGATYNSFTARRPKVRDIRSFLKNLERDATSAMELVLANLIDHDEKVIAEIDIADYAPMKNWFEGFLRPLMDDSTAS